MGLRDHPRHLGRGRAPRSRLVACPRDQPARPLPHRGRHVGRRHGDPAQRRDRRRRHAAVGRGRGHHAPAGAHGPHLRDGVGRLFEVLRPHARHRQDLRSRRGDRYRRSAVDRRAGHAAHHAYLPHRRCRRRGHHARSAPCGRAVRGPYPEGGVTARRRVGSRADRREREGRAHHHDRLRRRHRARVRGVAPGARVGARGPGSHRR